MRFLCRSGPAPLSEVELIFRVFSPPMRMDFRGQTRGDGMSGRLSALPGPVITSAAMALGGQGVGFNYAITASNSPTSYAAAGLPAGLSLNPATGVVTGIPTVAGLFSVTITATNAGGTGSAILTVTVIPYPPVINSSRSLTAAEQQFLLAITATNSPTSYSAASLPTGLSRQRRDRSHFRHSDDPRAPTIPSPSSPPMRGNWFHHRHDLCPFYPPPFSRAPRPPPLQSEPISTYDRTTNSPQSFVRPACRRTVP